MKIGIDIDDTLTNTKEKQIIHWKEYLKKYPQNKYTEKLPSNINTFGDPYINKFWDEYREELSFNTTFKKDASKVLHTLKSDGHTLCIITSRPDEKYKDLKLRLTKWFKENNIPITIFYTNIKEKALFAKNNNIDLIIDDDLIQCQNALKLNLKAILFNKDSLFNGPQATTWQEVYEIINH